MSNKKEFHFKSEKQEGSNEKRFHTFIILLLIDLFEKDQAEEINGLQFQSWDDFWDYLRKFNPDAGIDNVLTFTLTEFAEFANDGDLLITDYWLSHVQILNQ